MSQQEPQVVRDPGSDFSEVIEHFADVLWTTVNPYGAAVTFGNRSLAEDEPNKGTIRVRLGLQSAKTLAFLLMKGIRAYEDATSLKVDLPAEMLQSMGIPPEDWRGFTGG